MDPRRRAERPISRCGSLVPGGIERCARAGFRRSREDAAPIRRPQAPRRLLICSARVTMLCMRSRLVTAFVFLFALTAFAADYTVYVGTYTGPKSKGIYSFHFDAVTGKFTQPQVAAETDNPSFLSLDPKDHFLYAVNELEHYKAARSGAVSVFAIDPANGKLTFKQEVSSLGMDPAYIAVDHSGRDVLVANYTSG